MTDRSGITRACLRASLFTGLALVLNACGPASDSSAPDETTPIGSDAAETVTAPEHAPVTVWSYRPEPVVLPVLSAFTAATGIPTRHRIFPGDELLDALPAASDGERPDLVLTVDAIRFVALRANGQLRPMPAEALASVPAEFRDAEAHWAGISWRVRGLVQRADEAQELDWVDLPGVAAAGRLCVRPGAHVYNRSLLAWQLARFGQDEGLSWAEAVYGAPTVVSGGDRDQIRAVADGRCDVAIVNHYYLARMRLSEDDAERAAADLVLFGNPGQALAVQANISGIALVADSPNPTGGAALAAWMLDPANQGVYADPVAEFPISWPDHGLELGEILGAFEQVFPEAPWPAELSPAVERAEAFFAGRY